MLSLMSRGSKKSARKRQNRRETKRARMIKLGLLGLTGLAVLALVVVALNNPLRAESTYARPTATSTPTAEPTRAPSPTAVFIGDSYTAGAGGEGVKWTQLVAAQLGWSTTTSALGGTGYVTSAGTNGCGKDYCETYAEALPAVMATSPDVIVFTGGRNDLSRSADDVSGAAVTMFQSIATALPSTTVVVLSPWWDDDPAPDSLGELATALRAAAEANGAFFLDVGQPLSGHPDLMSPDGIHPNAEGYKALAAATEPMLLALDIAE